MLIDINLLPKKERKSISILLTSIVLACLLLLAGGYFYWQLSMLNSDLALADSRLETAKKLGEIQQNKQEEVKSSDSAEKLEQSVVWAEGNIIPSVPVMREFTSLLPERGFILVYAYKDTGQLSLSVQFDSNREAAYFLNRLSGSEWVSDAELTNLSIYEPEVPAGENPLNTSMEENEDVEFLPRYIGNFEITLNKNKVKAAVLENEEKEGAGGL